MYAAFPKVTAICAASGLTRTLEPGGLTTALESKGGDGIGAPPDKGVVGGGVTTGGATVAKVAGAVRAAGLLPGVASMCAGATMGTMRGSCTPGEIAARELGELTAPARVVAAQGLAARASSSTVSSCPAGRSSVICCFCCEGAPTAPSAGGTWGGADSRPATPVSAAPTETMGAMRTSGEAARGTGATVEAARAAGATRVAAETGLAERAGGGESLSAS